VMATDAPDLIDAGVDEQSVHPGVKAIRVAQGGQIAPGADEGVLDRVRRPVRIPTMSQAVASRREIAAPASSAKAS
jgi:hypothetical protein